LIAEFATLIIEQGALFKGFQLFREADHIAFDSAAIDLEFQIMVFFHCLFDKI